MAEYIEREAAVNICSGQYKECLRKSDWCGDSVAWNIGFGIKSLPAADVAPVVHGRWIAQDETFTRFMCSHCKSKNHRGGDNYCPNCGAKMNVTDINVGDKEG